MPFAVLQTDLTPPSTEQLRRAFQHVPGLTASDAHILGRDAFGIIVKNFPGDRAAALQGALRLEGIETEIVDETHLPAVPPGKQISRVDCVPEHLLIYDPLGRSFPLPWPHVMVLAAGMTRITEFVRVPEAVRTVRYNMHGGSYVEERTEYRSREERNVQCLAEIIITGAVLRYSITAERFNFICLGERRTRDVTQNFSLLIQELARFASHAALNRGASTILQQQPFAYPTKNAFHEEIVWTLWQLKKRL